jgi:WD40 repeat protein
MSPLQPIALSRWAALALAAAALALPARAPADVFGPLSLVSEGTVRGGAPQQAEYAHDAAISADGRYVAFDGAVGGITGVWRRDLASGAIEAVAGGDAELPSISANGRYISFTTTAQLVPADETTGPNVWVRDMEAGPEEPAYRLVSAVDGSSRGLTYAYGSSPALEAQTRGAVAAGRSAISADGQQVAFVTTAVSNLVADPQLEAEEEARGETPKPHTPALQVAVRNLQTQATTLVSGEYEPASATTAADKPVSTVLAGESFGAVYAGAPGFRPPPAYGEWGTNPPPGASISADGTTVAWMGEDVGRQVRMLAGEAPGPLYTEPLWRRIAPGAQTATMRVTGGSDPGDPACAASGETAVSASTPPADPCLGPFVVNPESAGAQSTGIWPVREGAGAFGDFVPRLSADGWRVAFLSGALPVALGENFGNHLQGEPADLYVADMHPGLTRRQALTPLTELAGAESLADVEPINEFDISPDGSQVAFTTRRTQFPLGFPAFVSAPAAEPGMSELFDADLGDGTLTRVTHGYEGGPSEQPHPPKRRGEEDAYGNQYSAGAQSPSFSADGALIAFSSTASNLVFGDGNTPPAGPLDGSDAFLVSRQITGALPTPQYISPAPQTSTEPAWTLGVTASSRPDGSVLLYIAVPGAGVLRATSRSSVVVSTARSARRARHASSRAAHARYAGKRKPRVKVASRTVASASSVVAAPGGELVTLVLRLGKRYAPLASRGGGLAGTVGVSFAASGQPLLRQAVEVTFKRTARAARRARKGSAATRGTGAAR